MFPASCWDRCRLNESHVLLFSDPSLVGLQVLCRYKCHALSFDNMFLACKPTIASKSLDSSAPMVTASVSRPGLVKA